MQERDNRKGYFLGGLVLGAVLALLVVGVGYAGYQVQRVMEESPAETQTPAPAQGESAVSSEMIDKLKIVEKVIRNFYYKEDYQNLDLQEGAYRGMLEALGDPYSTYYSAQELAELMNQTEGIYYGIGAFVSLDEVSNYPKIVRPIDNTPAQEAGLRADDIIYEVDGQSTYGMDLTMVVNQIKGEEGTTVSLTIYRPGEPDYLHMDVERRKVETPTVTYESLEQGMGYIQITEFDDVTVKQFEDALAQYRTEGKKGLILDLRANPGGNLSAVVDVARMLLPQGLIVYTEDRNGRRTEYTCQGEQAFDQPMVVLVDGNSASASEILAGAIQDYGIGTLVGTTTFGKGIVQQIVDLRDGTAVKLTVSSYFTPKGRNIHGTGIERDQVCEFDGDAYYAENAADWYDNQLEFANEVLAGMLL